MLCKIELFNFFLFKEFEFRQNLISGDSNLPLCGKECHQSKVMVVILSLVFGGFDCPFFGSTLYTVTALSILPSSETQKLRLSLK